MDKISWHIEPSSKCTLECPLCDRTWFYQTFKKRKLHDINIDHLIRFLSGTSPKVNLEGNNGDPIYHAEFHKLCAGLKAIDSQISITTNGSGKKKDWWHKLCKTLTETDSITFSIDGLEDTNHLYRKNAKWQSIMDAVEIVTKSNIKTVWKFIVFKHNQHQIESVKKMSESLGIDSFELIKSERWWKKELMPSEEYVNPSYQHQIAVTQGKDNRSRIKQNCMSVRDGTPDQNLYIDAEGDFYPCCRTGLYAFKYKNVFSPRLKKYNIKDNTIKQILSDSEVQNFFESTKSYDSADKCCKIYCGAPKINDRKKEQNII